MYHIVYLTSNLVNLKMYVGVHSTYNLDDGYLGSGKAFNFAILKYGKQNFKRTILHYAYDRKHAFEIETQIVDEVFIKRTDTYNSITGGMGITHTDETKLKLSIKQKLHWQKHPRTLSQKHIDILRFTNRNPTLETRTKKSTSAKNRKPATSETRLKISIALQGKIRSEETKLKMSIANIGRTVSDETRLKQSNTMKNLEKRICEHCGQSFDNGNYTLYHGGNCLSNPSNNIDDIMNQRAKSEEWKLKNRKPKTNKNGYKGKYINNGIQCKKVSDDELDTYINNGWIRGRLFSL